MSFNTTYGGSDLTPEAVPRGSVLLGLPLPLLLLGVLVLVPSALGPLGEALSRRVVRLGRLDPLGVLLGHGVGLAVGHLEALVVVFVVWIRRLELDAPFGLL